MRIIWSQLKIKRIIITFLFIIMASLLSHLVLMDQKITLAADKSAWQAGNIISDSIFTDNGSMSEADIQSFLDEKIGFCDIWGTQPSEYGANRNITRAQYATSVGWSSPPYTCLNKYYEVPKTSPSPELPVNNYSNPDQIPDGAKSAAWIIKDAATRYGINPKVLLVKIATESSGPLTTDQWPLFSQYRHAMGSHCPDSGPGGSANCDPNYSGFSVQMYSAAELLRWYLDSMNEPWWPYKKPYQTNSILWNVAPSGCGASDVYIQSKATAALYTYTPYQPNQAALNNMYGFGDGCSAYGNRNFWRVFVDWFGNALGPSTSNVSLPNGVYNIRIDNLALDIENGSKENISRLITAQPNSSESQKFKIERQEDNSYKLLSIYSGKVVEVHSASNQTGAQIIQYDWHGEDNQRWLAIGKSADTIYFINKSSGLALSASSGYVEQQGPTSYGYSQAISLPGTMPSASYINIENGIYRIASKINQGYAFDIYSSKPDNLLQYQLWSKHTEDNQKFSIEKLSDGSYKIISLATGKAMEVQSSSTSDGALIVQYDWHGEDNQHWLIQDAGEGYVRFENKATHKMLDISSRPIDNGAKAVQWRVNIEDSQEFILYQEETFATKYLDLNSGIYSISSKLNTSMSVDIYSSKPDNLLQYQLWSKHTEDNQKFSIEKLSDGSYKIISLATGKAMDLHSTSPYDGAQIIQYDWHGEDNQHWLIQDAGEGYVRFENKITHKIVDVESFPSNNGIKLIQRTKNYTSSQKFDLVPAF